MGFVIDSGIERAIWPHDRRIRFKTTWHRLIWPSVVERIRASYDVARNDRAAYEALSRLARERTTEWASAARVWPRLQAALDLVETTQPRKPQAA
jgi:hypothetical protein